MELAPCDHDLETAAELRGARREIFMRAPNWRTSWIGVVRSRGAAGLDRSLQYIDAPAMRRREGTRDSEPERASRCFLGYAACLSTFLGMRERDVDFQVHEGILKTFQYIWSTSLSLLPQCSER